MSFWLAFVFGAFVCWSVGQLIRGGLRRDERLLRKIGVLK